MEKSTEHSTHSNDRQHHATEHGTHSVHSDDLGEARDYSPFRDSRIGNYLYTSSWYSNVLLSIFILAILLLTFQIGLSVGFHRAMYMSKFGNSYVGSGYSRAFDKDYRSGRDDDGGNLDSGGGRMTGMMGGQMDQGSASAGFGASGKIIEVALPHLVIEGSDNIEKTVTITDKTIVRKFRDTLTSADLKVDDYAVVIGEPNDQGEISAKLIRLLPSPETSASPAAPANNI